MLLPNTQSLAPTCWLAVVLVTDIYCGVGGVSDDAPPTPQEKATAVKDSRDDAAERLAQVVKALKVDRTTSVSDVLTTDQGVPVRSDALVQGASFGESRWLGEVQLAATDVRIALSQVVKNVRSIQGLHRKRTISLEEMEAHSREQELTVTGYGAVTGPAQDKPIIVEGKAALEGEGPAEAALQNAFENAVRKAVGVQVKPRAIDENRAVLRSNIFRRSRGYIKSYKEFRPRDRGDAHYVGIRALVAEDQINLDLVVNGIDVQYLHDVVERPRVTVLVKDYADQKLRNSQVAQEVIERAFREKKIAVKDSDFLGQVVSETGDDAKKAAELARKQGVDITILGRVKANLDREVELAGQPYYFHTVTAELRAINNSDASVYVPVTVRKREREGSPDRHSSAEKLAEKAASEAAHELLLNLLRKWNEDNFRRTYEIVIDGISAAQVTGFKDSLPGLEGILEVQLRSLLQGRALLEIQYRFSSAVLFDTVVECLKTPPWTVTGIRGNRLEIVYQDE